MLIIYHVVFLHTDPGDIIILENTSNGKVLGIKDSDEVSMEEANNTAGQLWKKEETKIEGFFILKNSKSHKVLSAKVKSKYRNHALYVCNCFNAQFSFSNSICIYKMCKLTIET